MLDVELRATALAHAGEALVEYRVTNRSSWSAGGSARPRGAPCPNQSLLATWRPRGHQRHRRRWSGRCGSTIDIYAAFSSEPDIVSIADFDNGDVVRLIENEPQTDRSESSFRLRSAQRRLRVRLFTGPGRERRASLSRRPCGTTSHPTRTWHFCAIREERHSVLAREDRATQDHGGRPGSQRHRRGADGAYSRKCHAIRLQARSPQLRPHLDSRRLLAGARPALGRFDRRGRKPTSSGIPNASTKTAWCRRSSIWTEASTGDTEATLSSMHKANSSASPPIFIASPAIATFCDAIFEPVVRATRFIEELCARTNALYGPETRFHGLLAPSISHEGYSKPSYSYWDNFFALSAWRNCEYLALEIGRHGRRGPCEGEGQGVRRESRSLDPHDHRRVGHGHHPWVGRSRGRRPSSTSIAFEPCRVEDVLPTEFIYGDL